ncbi:hypothetical protein Vafri_20745, partial [Volvox africanus]
SAHHNPSNRQLGLRYDAVTRYLILSIARTARRSKYGSKVYIIHRRDAFRASKIMQKRALDNPKIEVLWNSVVEEAYGNARGLLGGVKLRNLVTNEVRDLELAGLFFAIGHQPATAFLGGQVQLDDDGYIVTTPGSTTTNIPGVFAAGDVQDKKWRQAITAAGSGCMSALEVRTGTWNTGGCEVVLSFRPPEFSILNSSLNEVSSIQGWLRFPSAVLSVVCRPPDVRTCRRYEEGDLAAVLCRRASSL